MDYEYYTVEELELIRVFGIDANILMRNGMRSIKEVEEYIEKYPFDKYKKYHALYYRGIGPARYERILDSLNRAKES